MSGHWCRSLAVLTRLPCSHSVTSRSCLEVALCPVLGASMLNIRLYSSGRPTHVPKQSACIDKSPSSSTFPLRNLSAMAAQGLHHPLYQQEVPNVVDIKEKICGSINSKQRKHLLDHSLARVVAEHLRPESADGVIIDCNPGPGVLTRELINAGAPRVVALEEDRSFLHDLRKLEALRGSQLKVFHCDFFKLDSVNYSRKTSPIIASENLFTQLGISERAWTDDILVKVVGILPQHKERNLLLKMAYILLERLSVFRYGRLELNLFLTEQEYLKMMSHPGDMVNYRLSSVLWQMACDIRLLMMVPLESFVMTRKIKGIHKGMDPSNQLCLVRLCPRPHLFSDGLDSSAARALIMLVRQCMGKRRSKLLDKLNQWSHRSGMSLLHELALPKDVLTGQLSPEQYLRLFLLMQRSQDFAELTLFEEL